MRGTARAAVLVALLSAVPAEAYAQAQPPAPGGTEQSAPAYHDYFKALGYGFSHGLFSSDQLAPLAIGTAGALAVAPFDRRISDAVRGRADGLGKFGEVSGHPLTLGGFSGGLMLGSLATDNARFRTYAFALSQSLVIAGSVTTATKLAVRRQRPNGRGRSSFPSGHAAGAFALAAVSSHYYGKSAGIPLYTLAAIVAASRVEYGKHFPADVIVGAMVGYISGRAAVRGAEHVTPSSEGVSFTISFVF